MKHVFTVLSGNNSDSSGQNSGQNDGNARKRQKPEIRNQKYEPAAYLPIQSNNTSNHLWIFLKTNILTSVGTPNRVVLH